MKENYPVSTANMQIEYELLLEGFVDWTLVRLSLIELNDEIGEMQVALEDCLGAQISASNMALFLISQLNNRSFVGKAPFVSNG